MPTTIIVDSPAALAEAVAARVEAAAAEALAARRRFALALPGGSVATTCCPRLATARVDWPRTHVFFGDERAVAPDHPDSNYGLAYRLLLSHVPLRAEHVHRMAGEQAAVAAASRYEAALIGTLGATPVLDLVLMGVGEDGHVCSLFPDHATFDAPHGWVAAVFEAPKPPPRRLTLTMPTLALARHVVVAAMGAGKAAVIRAAVAEGGSLLPVAVVARSAADVVFIVDADAGSLL